jgi:hypothetical protein
VYIIYNPDTNTAHQYYGATPAKHCESILRRDTSRATSHLMICAPINVARIHEGKFQMGTVEPIQEGKDDNGRNS